MSEIVTYCDDHLHTFAQIRLDDGKRILITITRADIKVYRLWLSGLVPFGTLYEQDFATFAERMARVAEVFATGEHMPTILEVTTNVVLSADTIDDVAPALDLALPTGPSEYDRSASYNVSSSR